MIARRECGEYFAQFFYYNNLLRRTVPEEYIHFVDGREFCDEDAMAAK